MENWVRNRVLSTGNRFLYLVGFRIHPEISVVLKTYTLGHA